MQHRATLKIMSIAIGTLWLPQVFGANLLQAYDDALRNDPVYAKAKADYANAKLDVWLARTGDGTLGSGILPKLSLKSSVNKNFTATGTTTTDISGLTITQPLFNKLTWKAIEAEKFSVKAAAAQFFAAEQAVMQRVASAYLNVLQARAILVLMQTQKTQLKQQYALTLKIYQAGSEDVTPVYQAKSQVDQAALAEIKYTEKLRAALANLAAITGKSYRRIHELEPTLPVYTPKPNRLADWNALCEKQNYVLQADHNRMLAQRETVKGIESGVMPTATAVGGYQKVNIDSNGQARQNSNGNDKERSLGLSLSFPVFHGGYDVVNAKKAQYQYVADSEQLQIDHRRLLNEMKQLFLTINASKAQLKAGQLAIQSAEQQLAATQAAYQQGQHTSAEVIVSLKNHLHVKRQFIQERFRYLQSLLRIKQLAGTLSPEDLHLLNSWMSAVPQPVLPMAAADQAEAFR